MSYIKKELCKFIISYELQHELQQKGVFMKKIFVFLENIRIFFNIAPLLAALAGDAYMMALLLYTAFAFLP